MLIGWQENTGYGGIIDLLANATDSPLVLIELKRDKTPRDVVTQSLFKRAAVLARNRLVNAFWRNHVLFA